MDTLPELQPADEALAKQVQNGDLKAFDLLLERYYKKILRYGNKFLLAPKDAEDAAQEIFLKAYSYINSFDTNRKFSPWLYRIAHNAFINVGKKLKSEPLDFFDFDTFFPHPSTSQTPETDLDQAQIKDMLDQCLNELPAKYREPLVLYYLEGLDYKDIGEILRIPVSSVGVRLNRAKKQLVEKCKKFKVTI